MILYFFVTFLQEAQFYLYALYNKNKPKSDLLMAEYGKIFFKVIKAHQFITISGYLMVI